MESSPNPISDLTGEESAIKMRNIGLGESDEKALDPSEENELLKRELAEM